MKKTVSILLALLMMSCLAGCTNTKDELIGTWKGIITESIDDSDPSKVMSLDVSLTFKDDDTCVYGFDFDKFKADLKSYIDKSVQKEIDKQIKDLESKYSEAQIASLLKTNGSKDLTEYFHKEMLKETSYKTWDEYLNSGVEESIGDTEKELKKELSEKSTYTVSDDEIKIVTGDEYETATYNKDTGVLTLVENGGTFDLTKVK